MTSKPFDFIYISSVVDGIASMRPRLTACRLLFLFSCLSSISDTASDAGQSLKVKYGSLSDELMAEIRESAPPTSFRLLLRLLRQFAIALFATFLVVVIVFSPKWDDPYLYKLDGNFYFVFISFPVGAMVMCLTLSTYFCHLVNFPLPLSTLVKSAALTTAFMVAIIVACDVFADIFPMPYLIVTNAGAASPVLLTCIYRSYPKKVSSSPRFRSNFWIALQVSILNVTTGFLFVFYNALFKNVSSDMQAVLSMGLPVMKFVVRLLSKRMTSRGSNNDFVHGAGFWIDSMAGSISVIVFTNIKNVTTFSLLMALDVAENVVFTLIMLSKGFEEIIEDVKEALEIVKIEKRESERKITMRRETINNSRAENATGVDINAAQDEATTLQRYLRSISLLEAVIENSREMTMSPRVAFVAGNLFFSELVECFIPIVMGLCILMVYYHPFSRNCQYLDILNDKSEAEVLTGVKYVVIDAAVELSLFACLATFLKIKLHTDIVQIGSHLISRTPSFFLLMTTTSVLYFMAMAMAHSGTDTTFMFSWLKGDADDAVEPYRGFNYTDVGSCRVFD